MSSQAEPTQIRGAVALGVAWAVVLLAVGGVVAYLMTQSPRQPAPATSTMVLELAPVQVPLVSAESAGAEGQETAPSEPDVAQPDVAQPDVAQDEPVPETVAEQLQADPGETATEPAAPATDSAPAVETPSGLDHGTAAASPNPDQGDGGHDREETQEAALPSGSGEPWRLYAADFDGSRAGPRIGVVLFGLGLSAAATESAIKQLPPEVTLSFSPYARLLEQWIALARANNHEVMLDLPLEPLTFPEDDPGPHALLTVLDEEQNEKRLDWLLRRATSYVGVAAVMGGRFTASSEHMMPLLQSLKKRGLLFLDNGQSEQSAALALSERLDVPFVANDRILDAAQASRVAINARLSEIERIAWENGFAVAMAQPYPVTIERLRDWALDLESRGFVLAPVTALAEAR